MSTASHMRFHALQALATTSDAALPPKTQLPPNIDDVAVRGLPTDRSDMRHAAQHQVLTAAQQLHAALNSCDADVGLAKNVQDSIDQLQHATGRG